MENINNFKNVNWLKLTIKILFVGAILLFVSSIIVISLPATMFTMLPFIMVLSFAGDLLLFAILYCYSDTREDTKSLLHVYQNKNETHIICQRINEGTLEYSPLPFISPRLATIVEETYSVKNGLPASKKETSYLNFPSDLKEAYRVRYKAIKHFIVLLGTQSNEICLYLKDLSKKQENWCSINIPFLTKQQYEELASNFFKKEIYAFYSLFSDIALSLENNRLEINVVIPKFSGTRLTLNYLSLYYDTKAEIFANPITQEVVVDQIPLSDDLLDHPIWFFFHKPSLYYFPISGTEFYICGFNIGYYERFYSIKLIYCYKENDSWKTHMVFNQKNLAIGIIRPTLFNIFSYLGYGVIAVHIPGKFIAIYTNEHIAECLKTPISLKKNRTLSKALTVYSPEKNIEIATSVTGEEDFTLSVYLLKERKIQRKLALFTSKTRFLMDSSSRSMLLDESLPSNVKKYHEVRGTIFKAADTKDFIGISLMPIRLAENKAAWFSLVKGFSDNDEFKTDYYNGIAEMILKFLFRPGCYSEITNISTMLEAPPVLAKEFDLYEKEYKEYKDQYKLNKLLPKETVHSTASNSLT